MGIKHLFQLIQEHAPGAVKTGEIKNQFGRKVAIVRTPQIRLFRTSADTLRMRMHILSRSLHVQSDLLQVHEHIQLPHRRTI